MSKTRDREFDRARRELLVQQKDLLTFLADAGTIVHCDVGEDRGRANFFYTEMKELYNKYKNPNMKTIIHKIEETLPYLRDKQK